MAKIVQAVATYNPGIEWKPIVVLKDVSEHVADRDLAAQHY